MPTRERRLQGPAASAIQAITQVAEKRNVPISTEDFHALNRCLDVAIAGAVTTYQSLEDAKTKSGGSKATESISDEM